MANHGRIDEMLFYAQLIEDYDRVITYHMQRRDYKLALEVLSKAPVAKVRQTKRDKSQKNRVFEASI